MLLGLAKPDGGTVSAMMASLYPNPMDVDETLDADGARLPSSGDSWGHGS
jgi:hypothetical protein